MPSCHQNQQLHNTRFPFPSKSVKRPNSFNSNSEKNKKIKINAVEPVIFGGQSLVIKEEGGELFVSHTRSALPPTLESFSDFCLNKTAILLPSTKKFPCSSNTDLLFENFNTFLFQSNIAWVADFVFFGAPSNISFYKAIVINTEIILSSWFLFECKNKKVKPTLRMLKDFITNFRAIFLHFPKYQNAYNKWIRD